MRWTEILTESVKKYEPMFTPFRLENGSMPPWVSARIRAVETLLKREDRVVWALRWERFVALKKNKPVQGNYEVVSRKILRDLQVEQNDLAAELDRYELMIEEYFAHWLSLPVSAIQNYNFARHAPEIIWEEFVEFEDAWKREANQKIHHETLYPETGEEADEDEDEIDCEDLHGWEREECENERHERLVGRKGKIEKIIDFGDRYAWWDLHRAACTIEGGAMGHCGNAPSAIAGDTVLSLRRDMGNGIFRPSLTFILRKGGVLGEMKGRANEKPNEKYWPYIIALLKDERVTEIEGGGHASANNFSVLDLPESAREELLAHNPNLLSLYDRLQLYKSDQDEDNQSHIIKNVTRRLRNHGFSFERIDFGNPNTPIIVIEEWQDRENYIQNEGRWTPMENLSDFFDNLEDELLEIIDDTDKAHNMARAARDDMFDLLFDSMINYTHDEYALDGVHFYETGKGFAKGVSIRDFLNPSSLWMNGDDDNRPIYDRIGSLDETCSEGPDWSDCKDAIEQDLSDEAAYNIAEFCFTGKDALQAAVRAVHDRYSETSLHGTGSPFRRHRDQLNFPYYDRPSEYGAKNSRD
jgi:hypothetical protein